MTPQDKRLRHEEVSEAQAAKALLDNPALVAWKEEQEDEIKRMLLGAPPGDDGNGQRLAAQARLQELNALGSSLEEKINTGMMAEQQLAEDRARQERKAKLREVSNG